MIIKNISGATKTFTFSNEISASVANNAELIVPNSPEVVADALRYASKGLIEIVEGTPDAQLIQSASQPERILIATTAQPSDGDVIEVGGQVFEWDDDDTVTEGNVAVEIGGSRAASLTNLLAAIETNAALADFAGRGVVDDGTTTYAAVSLPEGVTAASVDVDVSGTTGFTAYKKAAEAGESLVNVILSRTVATVASDIIFSTELSEIIHVEVQVYDASYAKVAWAGTIHFKPATGGGLIVLKNGTDPDIAVGHTILIIALGKA